jgi:hypothetical protein
MPYELSSTSLPGAAGGAFFCRQPAHAIDSANDMMTRKIRMKRGALIILSSFK